MSTDAKPARIVIVDDDPSLLKLLSMRLEDAGYDVAAAASGEEALTTIRARPPQLVITDLRMAGMDGMALFEALRDAYPTLPVMILTAHGTIPDAVDATRRGVAGYLTKPFESHELVELVGRTLAQAPAADDAGGDEWRGGIVTRSSTMRETLAQARRAAASEASVLIQSESGTGKELLARAIHRASRRAAAPFVGVNCSAIPEQLLESELFGHSKGSFSGATRSHEGLFRAADGGTLFLDEIGDMPLSFQSKLLRALQEGEIRPVGSTATVPVDVRVVCATHRDLEQRVAEESFREDLYYRLAVVVLELPRLADRREDVPLLANHFLGDLREHGHGTLTGFAPEAMELLVAASWPGNVRQLRNVVEQCAILATTPLITAALVQKALRRDTPELAPFAEARDRFEADYLVRLLQITEGNVSQAARLAQRNRSEFYKLLRRHSLDPELFRTDPE